MTKYLMLLVLTASGFAQTISPVVVQYRGKARGVFTVSSAALVPLAGVVVPYSFSVDENGNVAVRPLDNSTHVRLSVTSFRIPPKGSYTVSYDVTCDQAPCWLEFLTYLTGFGSLPLHKGDTAQVGVVLPEVVYITGRQAVRRDDVTLALKGDDIEIHNLSGEYTRVQTVEMHYSDGKSETIAGFPLFPSYTRRLHAVKSLRSTAVHFQGFKLEANN